MDDSFSTKAESHVHPPFALVKGYGKINDQMTS